MYLFSKRRWIWVNIIFVNLCALTDDVAKVFVRWALPWAWH